LPEKDYVLKEVCAERYGNVREDLQEIKKNQKDMSTKFRNFKTEVVQMVKSASNGEPIKVENHWSAKDKVLVVAAVLSSPVLVAFIEAVMAAIK